ncbi:hypothetical protein [Pseudomonas aegrilactucae]|nr:hypothetical protein [Pseudomonas aegrilactucae]
MHIEQVAGTLRGVMPGMGDQIVQLVLDRRQPGLGKQRLAQHLDQQVD